MSAEGEIEGGNLLESKLAAIRRYWWIVLAVVCLAVAGALVSTARTPTTYLGRTSLIVSSNDRAPEQDAVLLQGYVSYFNNAAYQQQLLAATGVDAKAVLSAEAAAASPILIISATASNPESAQSAAIAVAKAFKDDINKTHDQMIAAAIATLQDQLDTARGRKDEATIAALQERLGELQADRNNVLQELQNRGGVSVQSPSLFNNLVLALAGGMVMGVLAALALARFSQRLRSRQDVADRLGLTTLVELPGARTKGAQSTRERRLRQLANILRARLAGPSVVVVTQATDGAATRVVARALAMEWASEGYATVLVRFGGGVKSLPPQIGETTSVRRVEASALLSRLRAGPVPGMSILDMSPRFAGEAQSLPAMKVTEVIELEHLVGAFIIIETPAILDSADAQAASLAADATILVIDTQVATVSETREAVEVLRQPGVVLLGAVLVPMGDEQDHSDGSGLDEGSNPDGSELDEGSNPDGSELDEGSNPDGSHIDEGNNPDGSHIDEGNGHHSRSSGVDAWQLAPWASPTRSAESSRPPTSSGLTDSSEPRRRHTDDVRKPAQDDAAGNGVSSRRVQTGRK
jgi:capsular polysaccharide biosynthesis protein